LMRRSGADEADAYRRLQKLATDRRCKLAEAAQWVLTVDDATRPPDGPTGTGITR
jgi:AmiR/NasT family two-component response regulator